MRRLGVSVGAAAGSLLLAAAVAACCQRAIAEPSQQSGSGEAIKASLELEATLAPYVGQVLDLVELSTGARFVRPTLQGMSTRLG